VEFLQEGDKNEVHLNAAEGDGMLILKGITFSSGTIECMIKGKNAVQQSFVGIAFHLQDERTFDAVYFRPFNFRNEDTIRRRRSVQYISAPGYGWETLRQNFPGVYENRVTPIPEPDDWFHLKLVVNGPTVSVYVDGAPVPSLTVNKLSSTVSGGLALWVGNNSGGSFANLVITPAGAVLEKK
jgi:hypothetical protein